MTTSSGAICLYLVSREQGLQELHSFVAPTLFPRRDPLRLAMRADWRNVFLDEDQKWNLCGSKSVIESQKRADAWERI